MSSDDQKRNAYLLKTYGTARVPGGLEDELSDKDFDELSRDRVYYKTQDFLHNDNTDDENSEDDTAVSYTHLTLPTNREV